MIIILAYALAERNLVVEWLWRIVYAAFVVLAAINTPVARDMGSPLTAAMLRAARGTLSDSIRHHVTATNLSICTGLLLLGALVPFAWNRLRFSSRPASAAGNVRLGAAGLLVFVAGRFAMGVTDTRGMERTPLFAIAGTVFPRIGAVSAAADWRASQGESPAPAAPVSLAHLRSAAAGSNVLLVVLESVGAQYLKSYGATRDPAPNFTALTQRGVLFENAYSVYPESVRGLVTFLASRYPGFDVANARHAAIASPSLATELGRAGYRTALFHSGRFIYLGMQEVLAESGFELLEDAGHIGGNHNSSFGADEPSAVRRVLAWIDSLPRGSRFFATYLPIAGHHPYAFEPPAPFPAETDIDRYHNAIFDSDRALGTLLDGLRARGLESNTVVIIASDHGEAFGQHQGNYGHTLAIHEENVKVPLLVVPPHLAGAMRIGEPASLIDVAPTVLDMLGVAQPAQFQGTSLLSGRRQMALFFTDYSLGLVGARDGCRKYIYEMETRRSRMFDVCVDPQEQNDVAGSNAKLADRYREHLMRWLAAQVAALQR